MADGKGVGLARPSTREGDFMAKVNVTQELPVPAQAVWQVIGGFNALPDWHPAVEKSETSKSAGETTRTLTLAGGGGTIVERLEQTDEKERTYSYSILSGPVPVANYTATIRVREAASGLGCSVEWSSEFTPSGVPEGDATAAVRGIYEAGFENLRKMFGA
ncbi:MAG: SRPBCC family protein [Kiloniellales bacterium]|nr:SRPBCC family protein [Kiloniellales bacterium]